MTCAHPRIAVEPLEFMPEESSLPSLVRFASVNVCAVCQAVRSEPKMAYQNEDLVRKAVKAFNGTSWAMMMDAHRHPPYKFVMGSTGILVPNGYKGPLKAQADLMPLKRSEMPQDESEPSQAGLNQKTPPARTSQAGRGQEGPAQTAENDQEPESWNEGDPF